MIRKMEVTDYPRLIEIWSSAVEHTHDFLKKEDFVFYKEQLPTYFGYVNLFGYEYDGVLQGFMGVAEGCLEMLFIHDDWHGKGIGRKLLNHGIENLGVTKVDVNEQNEQAVGFYEHVGFHTVQRSAYDGQGKAYPILHMQL